MWRRLGSRSVLIEAKSRQNFVFAPASIDVDSATFIVEHEDRSSLAGVDRTFDRERDSSGRPAVDPPCSDERHPLFLRGRAARHCLSLDEHNYTRI